MKKWIGRFALKTSDKEAQIKHIAAGSLCHSSENSIYTEIAGKRLCPPVSFSSVCTSV